MLIKPSVRVRRTLQAQWYSFMNVNTKVFTTMFVKIRTSLALTLTEKLLIFTDIYSGGAYVIRNQNPRWPQKPIYNPFFCTPNQVLITTECTPVIEVLLVIFLTLATCWPVRLEMVRTSVRPASIPVSCQFTRQGRQIPDMCYLAHVTVWERYNLII